MPTDFLSLFAVISATQVPYVVVGGLAMLLHGIDRVTGDIDLVIDLAPGTSADLINTLVGTGKDSTNRRPTVDVLLACPVPFKELLDESVIVTLGAAQIRVASVAHLIRMKQQTARPRDLDDVERLLVLQQRAKTS